MNRYTYTNRRDKHNPVVHEIDAEDIELADTEYQKQTGFDPKRTPMVGVRVQYDV